MKLDCCPGYQALGADRWGAEVLPVVAQGRVGCVMAYDDPYDGIWMQRWMLPLLLTAQWWHSGSACTRVTQKQPGTNMLFFWWPWKSTDSPAWRLLEQFCMSLPLDLGVQDPTLLWEGIWHFGWCWKKKSSVGMKWAFLKAPWDFVHWLFHGVSSCCSPGKEEAAQPADLWPPLVSHDGQAVTHVPALMWALSRQECSRRYWPSRVVQSSQGLFKHSFAEKRCAMITHWLTRNGSQCERGTGRPAEPSNFCTETTSCCGHCMHRADLAPVFTQWHNLSIIDWNNDTGRSSLS